ncbi:MAG: TetR/AcrR family transcriptional regulator [Lachnospiraceae bacterium]|nr:TetR/AcrR family transcriptional regulator [Lachnospiraceae bacterium]
MKIIQAALALFAERGYYGTKTSQMSRRAGIPPYLTTEAPVLFAVIKLFCCGNSC